MPAAWIASTIRSWPGTVSEVSTRSGFSAMTSSTRKSRSRPSFGMRLTTSTGKSESSSQPIRQSAAPSAATISVFEQVCEKTRISARPR